MTLLDLKKMDFKNLNVSKFIRDIASDTFLRKRRKRSKKKDNIDNVDNVDNADNADNVENVSINTVEEI